MTSWTRTIGWQRPLMGTSKNSGLPEFVRV
jgi:hypothetical protein